MKLLVTGGSGFIGSHVLEHASKSGYACLSLDIAEPALVGHRASWARCDVRDEARVRELVCGFAPTHVLHLAARTDTDGTVIGAYDSNTVGSQSVISAVSHCPGVERFVLTSTQFVCRPGYTPVNDRDYNPHTVYGESKVISEELLREAGLACSWAVVRPTNIWGARHPRYPSEFWRVLAAGLYLHPRGRTVRRTYGYVENVVHQIFCVLTADRSQVDGETFYLGDPPIVLDDWVDEFSVALRGRRARRVPYAALKAIASVGDAAKVVKLKFPLTSQRLRSMTESYVVPVDKTLTLCGCPPVELPEAVAETVDWFRRQSRD